METSVSAILSQELTSIICEHMPLSSKGCGKVTTHRRATLKEKHLIIQPWSTIVFEEGLEKHYLCNFFSLALFYLAKMYILFNNICSNFFIYPCILGSCKQKPHFFSCIYPYALIGLIWSTFIILIVKEDSTCTFLFFLIWYIVRKHWSDKLNYLQTLSSLILDYRFRIGVPWQVLYFANYEHFLTNKRSRGRKANMPMSIIKARQTN